MGVHDQMVRATPLILIDAMAFITPFRLCYFFFENKQDLDKYAALEVSSKHMDWDQEYICLVVCRAAAEKLFLR